MRHELLRVRNGLVQATALVDRLLGQHGGPALDQAVLGLLAGDDGELSTLAISRLVRRRKADVAGALRLLVAAGQVERGPRGGFRRARRDE